MCRNGLQITGRLRGASIGSFARRFYALRLEVNALNKGAFRKLGR